MANRLPAFDSMSQDQLLEVIAGAIESKHTSPAFTLLLGSGFSAPLIPTAGQVVARDVAWWLFCRRQASGGKSFAPRPAEDAKVREFEQQLWPKIQTECKVDLKLRDGLPATDAENVGEAYQAIMSGPAVSGLSDPRRRRDYLRDLCKRIGPRVNGAHIFLADILRAQESLPRPFCRTIFTTNFDPLLQRSLQLVSRLYVMSDRPEALEPPEDEDHDAIHLVYTHGSVHRYLLLNNSTEMAKWREKNAAALVPYLQRHGVLVLGYSGWQDATMKALTDCQSFDGNLYWCDLHLEKAAETCLSKPARDLLANKRGNAYYVPIAGADELMLALHRRLGLDEGPRFIRDPIGQMIENLKSVEVSDAREPANEPRAIDTLKDSRNRTIARLEAAWQVFENPEQVQPVNDAAVTAKTMDDAFGKAEAGDLDQAIALWTKVGEDQRMPEADRAQALLNRGVAHDKRGRRGQAIADYTRVTELHNAPADEKATALNNRGVAYGKQGRPDLEIADYSGVMAVSNAPVEQRAMALNNRGVAYGKQGWLEQAIADYTAVIDLPEAPVEQRAAAFIRRGVAYGKQGRLKEAIAHFTTVIAMPDVPPRGKADALANRGWFRFTNRPPDLTGLREDSEAALAITPWLNYCRFNLGLALFLAGESQSAIKEYARAALEADHAAQIRTAREDLEQATMNQQAAGIEEILALLRSREADLGAGSR